MTQNSDASLQNESVCLHVKVLDFCIWLVSINFMHEPYIYQQTHETKCVFVGNYSQLRTNTHLLREWVFYTSKTELYGIGGK